MVGTTIPDDSSREADRFLSITEMSQRTGLSREFIRKNAPLRELATNRKGLWADEFQAWKQGLGRER